MRISWSISLALLTVAPFAESATQEEIVRSFRGRELARQEIAVTLERTVCMGNCPAYRVTLTGDGAVHYEGLRYVKTMGVRHGTVESERVLQVANMLLRARFFDAEDRYSGIDGLSTFGERVTVGRGFTADVNPTILTLRLGAVRKEVSVFDTDPLNLAAVAAEIDSAVQIEKWIGTVCERPRSGYMPDPPPECSDHAAGDRDAPE